MDEKIAEALVAAMRYWKYYAETGERDLTVEPGPEGETYRDCLAVLGLGPTAAPAGSSETPQSA